MPFRWEFHEAISIVAQMPWGSVLFSALLRKTVLISYFT